MLDRFFGLTAHQTTIQRELLAGVTTFLTMAYILFVQPAMLSTDFTGSPTGLAADAVLLATCIASAGATLLMGLYARCPIALAPGMGQNAFFVSVIMTLAAAGHAESWRIALGIVFVAGVLFLLLSLLGVREAMIQALSPSLRNSIAVGIGLFIAFLGLKAGNIVIDNPATFVALKHVGPLSVDWIVFWTGFFVTAALLVCRIPGSVVCGILVGTGVAIFSNQISFPESTIGFPQEHAVFRFDIVGALSLQCLPFLFVFLYMDIFDTMGTLVGVGEQAGLMKDGQLPRMRQALMSDAVGTVVGACLGTSTVTSYIESAAGVQQGGRTGLTAVTVACLFLLALLFAPWIAMIGQYPPITAPALVIVGAMMFGNITKISWDDPSEAIPAFLVVVGIPLTFSIADGMALGLVSYPVLKLFSGRGRDVHWVMYVMAIILVVYFFARAAMG